MGPKSLHEKNEMTNMSLFINVTEKKNKKPRKLFPCATAESGVSPGV